MLQRPELDLLKKKGYEWQNPFDVIKIFEKKISDYTGSPYVTVTDSCTHSLELSLRYLIYKKEKIDNISIPSHTYISIPMLLKKLNLTYTLKEYKWQGYYYLEPTNVIDMAQRFTKNCYISNSFCCLSFGNKKNLKINRGGAILTDNKEAHDYFQLARADGRDYSNTPWSQQENFSVIGYHYNLSIEDCGRGVILMDELSKTGPHNKDTMEDCFLDYPDLRKKINF